MKRRLNDADVYLLFNESAAPLDTTITLSTTTGKPELWDAQTASVTPLPAQTKTSPLEVTLHFDPYATRVVVVRQNHPVR